MYSLRSNISFAFAECEMQKINQTSKEISKLLKEKDLTYIEASEVLKVCEDNLKMSLLR